MIVKNENIAIISGLLDTLRSEGWWLQDKNVASGYYSKYSSRFVLTECVDRGDCIEGYSSALKKRVLIERKFMTQLVKGKDLTPYNIREESYQGRMLINFPDVESVDDYNLHNYLEQTHCLSTAEYRNALYVDAKLSDKLLQMKCHRKILFVADMLQSKAAIIDNDEIGNVYEMGIYGVTLQEHEEDVLMLILNSRWFPCYLNAYMQNTKQKRNSKYDAIVDLPRPESSVFSKASTIASPLVRVLEQLQKSKKVTNNNDYALLWDYLQDIVDQIVFELYYPDLVYGAMLNVMDDLLYAPWMSTSPMLNVNGYIQWLMKPDNQIRKRLMLLDTRSPELLYKIHETVKK